MFGASRIPDRGPAFFLKALLELPGLGSRPRFPLGALRASGALGWRLHFLQGALGCFFLVHPNSSSSFLSQLDNDLFSPFHRFAEFNLRLGLSTSPFWSPSRSTSLLAHLSKTFLEQLYQGEITLSLELEAFNSDVLSKVSKN